MKRWWASWNEPIDESMDWRPIRVPPKAAIPAYWCSGYGDCYATVCAVIDAESEEAAEGLVSKYWNPGGFRFLEEKEPGWRPGDRFPWPRDEEARKDS